MNLRAILAVLAVATVSSASADSSVKIENLAASKSAEAGRVAAMPFYRAAAEQRVKEAETLFAKKKVDDLDLDLDSVVPDAVDSDLRRAAEARETDAEALHYLQTAVDFDYGAKPRLSDEWMEKALSVAGVSKEVKDAIARERARIAKDRDPAEEDPPPSKPAEAKADKLAAALAAAEGSVTQRMTRAVQAGLWSRLGYEAFLHFRPDLVARAVEEIAKLGQQPSYYAGRWVLSVRSFENLKTFPKDEAATVSPKTLDEMGVKEKHTIVAGELDWDPEDATACVEDAITSGATTIVLEKHETPWYVRCIVPRSNQRIVLRKGVKVLMDKVSRQMREKCPMILLKNVRNVIIEGEGDNYVGKFATLAERRKNSNDYGGSGIDILGAKNCVVRNITFGANSMDGVCVSGGDGPSEEIWLENLVLNENYRQAMSVCDVLGLYCRNVSFLNTNGNEPYCGIDFEPAYENQGNADCYFYDCTFGGNTGCAVNWSSSSYYPVTAHLKRCHFLKAPNCYQINIFARCGVYMGNDVHAPSKLVFEDCDMAVNTDSFPIRFDNASLFDVEVKGFRVKDIGPHDPNRPAGGNAPVVFNLARSYGSNVNAYQEKCGGHVVINGLEVEGFEKQPILEFRDRVGTYSVAGISGSGKMNGKTYDFSQFSHKAPEVGLEGVAKFDPKDFLPPAKTSAANPTDLPASFLFSWKGAWYDPEPVYRALYFEDGAWKIKKIQTCVTELGLAKQPVAYYSRGNGGLFKIAEKKRGQPYTLYFEVPAAGKPCVFKMTWGTGVLKNAKGEVVKEFVWSHSTQYASCTPASDASEIWSLELTSPSTFRFFAPFTGIISEDPAYLPRKR